MRAGCMSSNSTAIAQVFSRIDHKSHLPKTTHCALCVFSLDSMYSKPHASLVRWKRESSLSSRLPGDNKPNLNCGCEASRVGATSI